MSCGNLCTAAKCEELENKIAELESTIEQFRYLIDDLDTRLELHISHEIPRAHNYEPSVSVTTGINLDTLSVEVQVDNQTDSDQVLLSGLESPEVTVEVLETNAGTYLLRVQVGEQQGEGTLELSASDFDFQIRATAPDTYDFELGTGGDSVVRTLTLDPSLQGAQGEPGAQGEQGERGEPGLRGERGFRGFGGAQGEQGIQGIQGEQGIQGIQGEKGEKGDRGNDADTVVGGNAGTGGGNSVSCEQLQQELQDCCEAILAAIAAVDSKVTKVESYVTLDVEWTSETDLTCPIEGGGELEGETESALESTELTYQGKALEGIFKLIKLMDTNIQAIFAQGCDFDGIAAIPAWWQVRLGADVPQIVCSFRKAGSSTYHSIAIPHPRTTDRPTTPLLPEYTKGNWQGMVTCKDNSKFIINCVSKEEAERMCNLAIELIDGQYLEFPPRVYIGERKGQAVSVDSMTPATMFYYERGQQNLLPNWRVSVRDLNP